MTLPQLESWLWDAACAIRGATDAPKFKDFILPLIFYKRLSDVFDDEFQEQRELWGDEAEAYKVVEEDHADFLKNPVGRVPVVRFYVPLECAWPRLRNHPADGTLGQFVTDCMRQVARLNPTLDGVLNVVDYAATQAGQRILDDHRLEALVEVLSRHRIGLADTSPDILGHAYEYLLRKFAEGQGQSAGEFFTPMEVGHMMGLILDPPPMSTLYDPTMGSAGLLIKAMDAYIEKNGRKGLPRLNGQELNPTTWAMAMMNAILHGYEGQRFHTGDTFRNPRTATHGGGLMEFDRVIANPMWNQKGYPEEFFENDPYQRFKLGYPPSSSADWAWAQHMVASLNDTGIAAMVIDTGAASRGSGGDGNNKEKTIRSAFIEKDLIEAVILLPENLFYNTTAAGLVMVFRRGKPEGRRGQAIVINASTLFLKGRPKNIFTENGVKAVAEVYHAWEERDQFSRILTLEDVRANDYNLSPSAYIQVGEKATHRALADILVDLAEAREMREKADIDLTTILRKLGFHGET